MLDDDFKMETVKALSRIEQKVDFTIENFPECEKALCKNKIKNNRFLIIGLYTILGSALAIAANFTLLK